MLKENLSAILNEISDGNNLGEKITLVGATKFVPVETINLAVGLGLNVVAENKVQEFREKHGKIIGADEQFIGHLQTNKVKYLVGNVSVIQSVDSVHLANTISDCAQKKGVVQNVFLEVNIGGELSKSGFTPENVAQSIKEVSKLNGIKITGLMAMLPKTDDETLKASLCDKMRNIFDTLKNDGYSLCYLSMGMSGDYKTAIKHGSNMIRVGTQIFGKRNYGEQNNGII